MKKSVLSNMLWRFLERAGAQGVSFVVSLILARLLDPSVYGTVALVTVFTVIMQVFVDSGLGNALIQKKNADDLDFSTVFYFNIIVCLGLYFVMYFAAPFISDFYGRPDLIQIIRVLSLMLVISGVKNVQQAYVSRNLLFRRFFFATLGGTILAAVVGIWMAYKGFGVWALVAQMLTNAATDTVILWITVKWRPKLVFSWTRLKGLFSFGSKLLVSALLETGYNQLSQLIIGKIYTSADLAYYNKGQQYPNLIVTNINSSIDSVLLPVMASEQDDIQRVRNMTRKAINTSSYIIWPMMVGFAACAEPLIRLVLTEKWLPCVPYVRVFCLMYAFFPIHTANLSAIKAIGRSDLFLRLEIIKKAIGIAVLAVTMWISPMAMSWGLLGTSIISSFINAYPNKKLLEYSWQEQIKDILPSAVLSGAMGIAVYSISLLDIGDVAMLLIQIPLGVVIYIACSALLRLDGFSFVLNTIKKFVGKK